MNEWKKFRLGDIAKTNTNTYSQKEKWSFVNYLDTGNINQNKIEEIKYIDLSREKLPSRAKRKVRFNSIIYSNVRPNQLHYGIVKDYPDNFLVSTGFTVIDVNESIAVPDYIYYILTLEEITNHLQAIGEQSVSAYPSIKPSDLENLEIWIPDLTEQSKIVTILSSIDEKIAVNSTINDNLEQQAQALFKSWFIDFEPFDGKKPLDWSVGTVDNLSSEIICGKTPSTKRKEYYGNDIPFITIPDMHNNTYIVATDRALSLLGAESQIKKMLPRNSICVSCIGTAGLVSLVSTESQTNQQINSIIPKDGYSSYYIYLLMKTLCETINKLGQSGSTIVNLNKAQFKKISVLIPSIETMQAFDKIVLPIFELILSNQLQNTELVLLRDTLLSKLMSGEIDVSNIKI